MHLTHPPLRLPLTCSESQPLPPPLPQSQSLLSPSPSSSSSSSLPSSPQPPPQPPPLPLPLSPPPPTAPRLSRPLASLLHFSCTHPAPSPRHSDSVIRPSHPRSPPISMLVSPSDTPAAAHAAPGRPNYQHDRHLIHRTSSTTLYAVADGHGDPSTGHLVSQHALDLLPSHLSHHGLLSSSPCTNLSSVIHSAILQLDTTLIRSTTQRRLYAGSTLCAVVHHSNRQLVCINVGDSRAILVATPSSRRVTALSRDHACEDAAERKRIENAGGAVIGGLLNGWISMSRALGDNDLKAHRNLTKFPIAGRRPYGRDLFIADPDVTNVTLQDDDVAIVIASDGVWSRLSNEAVAKLVMDQLARGANVQEVSEAIVKRALKRGSTDNVTALVALVASEDEVRARVNAPGTESRRFRITGTSSTGRSRGGRIRSGLGNWGDVSLHGSSPQRTTTSTRISTTTSATTSTTTSTTATTNTPRFKTDESSGTLESEDAGTGTEKTDINDGKRMRFSRRQRSGRQNGRGGDKFLKRLWSQNK